jgi:Fe-S-cluster containining protein
MGTEEASPIQVDVRLVQGADGPKLTLSCSDRTSTVPLSQLLSTFRSLTNRVVDAAVKRERNAGREISCKAGCGACCRQLIPLSVTEARQLPRLIAGLEEAHRSRVMARFDEAISKLRANDMWDRLERNSTLSRDQRLELAIEYFRLGIPCPFLEEESCSIHPIRPVICRQYLVTSAPVHCADPSPQSIAPVALAANVLGALTRVEAREPNPPQPVPMILASILNLDEDDPRRTVPDWMGLLLDQIKKIREERIAAGKEPDSRATSMTA